MLVINKACKKVSEKEFSTSLLKFAHQGTLGPHDALGSGLMTYKDPHTYYFLQVERAFS